MVQEYLSVAWRTVGLMVLFLAVALILGKRHIAEMSVLDVITLITLGSVAGADLADPKVPHGPTILAVVLIALFHVAITKLTLKRRIVGRWLSFDPTVVIQRGVILKDNLDKLRYPVDKLISHLRLANVFDLAEVTYAILEPDGQLSVQKNPSTSSNRPPELPLAVIMEGRISRANLRALGLTEPWLRAELGRSGYVEHEVFLAMATPSGQFYLSPNRIKEPAERIDH